MSTWKVSRRTTLKGLAASVALPAVLRGEARAQGGRIVVGTWGGDYAKLLAKNIEDPLLKPKGFEVDGVGGGICICNCQATKNRTGGARRPRALHVGTKLSSLKA